jgi:hypothetical protein
MHNASYMEATTNTTYGADSARKESLMASTSTLEAEVREFAREFPTPNVQRAVALCEAGRLDWADVHKLFQGSLANAVETVA